MGLFDFIHKNRNLTDKSNDEENASESVVTEKIKDESLHKEQEDTSKESTVKEVLFTFMVEDNFLLKENKGIVVKGNVHGKMHNNDDVYIIKPGGQVIKTQINGIEIGDHKQTETVKDASVGVLLSEIKTKEELPKHSILTSICPQTVVDVDKAIENGQLLGLSMEYQRFGREQEFMSVFIYTICHAHFLTPTIMDKKTRQNENGTASFTENSKIGFMTLLNPSNDKQSFLPIFTDWRALRLWKNLFEQENKPANMVLTFPNVVTFSKNGMDGAVINPFGPVPITLPRDYIDKITAIPAYIKEFVEKPDNNVKQEKLTKDTTFRVGVPAKTPESEMVRENIISTVKREKCVHAVYFLMKIDEEYRRAYFCILDCEENTERDIFPKIASAVSPLLNEVKYVDMITYKQYGNRLEGMQDNGCIYRREEYWKKLNEKI